MLFVLCIFLFVHSFDELLLPTACDPPEEGFAECCFEEEPLFYMITIIDQKVNEEMVSHLSVMMCHPGKQNVFFRKSQPWVIFRGM